MVDNREGAFPASRELIAAMCTRRTSIGADGLILVEPSATAAVRMRYYNADGGEAEMCGNGARCFVAFARELGIGTEPLVFETMERVLTGSANGDAFTIEMGEIKDTRLNLTLNVEGTRYQAHFTNTGVPHAVIFCYRLDEVDVEGFGRAVRYHEAFQPGGANADFVEVNKKGELVIRTYERGVEGETLACGTGVVAAAVVAHLVGNVRPPVTVYVRSGDTLTVEFGKHGGTFSDVTLTGPAVHVYDGVYRMAATR
ncbi:MAG: diaminopimelate epimerase [Verrucomicrobia bacterium]|nr:diaminopimelate epimerase [Verrucomicrobiota bacterium]